MKELSFAVPIYTGESPVRVVCLVVKAKKEDSA